MGGEELTEHYGKWARAGEISVYNIGGSYVSAWEFVRDVRKLDTSTLARDKTMLSS